jgi:hypothetical protein
LFSPSQPPERGLRSVAARQWSGPTLAVLGAVVIGTIVLRPTSAESPLAWWIMHSALAPERVLPLIGLGIAFGLVGTRSCIVGALLLGIGIALGFTFYKPILDPLWAIPSATQSNFMTGPIASVVSGLLLVGGQRWRPWLLAPAAGIIGLMLALAIVVTDPSLNDPTNRYAGVMIGLWIVSAVSLSLRAFRRGWFEIAGRIVGSWLIAIGLLYGGVALMPKATAPAPSLPPPSPELGPRSNAIPGSPPFGNPGEPGPGPRTMQPLPP